MTSARVCARDPAADGLVQLVGVLRPRPAGGEPRLGDEVRPPDQPQHPFGDALRAGRHGHPVAVGGLGSVLRGALLDRPVAVRSCTVPSWSQRGDLRAEHAPGSAPRWPRRPPAPRRSRPRDWRATRTAYAVASDAIPSARPNGGSVGGPSGSPVDRREPAHRLGQRAEAGPAAYGPVWPNAVTRASTSRGLCRASTVVAQPPALERAGPEVLDHARPRGRPAGAAPPPRRATTGRA